MSNCECGGGNHFHENKGIPYNCERINHVFDPNPPAFYGTWSKLYGYDPSSRTSITQSGISTGLYRNNGSLMCNPCRGNITMLTGVETHAKISLVLKFNYTNSNCNNIVEVIPGKVYTVRYLENGTIKGCTGLVTNIYKVSQINDEQEIYKIRFDCSSNYNNNVVVIKTDQIRELQEYIPYQNESIEIVNASHAFGTTLGRVITDVVIIDAELDKNKNIIKGSIIQGNLDDARTVDGLIIGKNNQGHILTIKYGQTAGGKIIGGTILSGILRKGEITEGVTNEEKGIISHAVVKGMISQCIISNSKVIYAQTIDNGQSVIIDPTIRNGDLIDATISGSNMITRGGITVDNITTDGITIGGNPSGGIAIGYINNECFHMINGTTTPEDTTPISDQDIKNLINGTGTNTKSEIYNTGIAGINTSGRLVTQGGVLIGGTVIGGTKMGNAIYGATIIGGTVSGGITKGGITTGGILIPGTVEGIYGPGSVYDRNSDPYIRNNPPDSHENNWYGYYKKTDDLLLMIDKATGSQLFTNFGKAKIADVRTGYNTY